MRLYQSVGIAQAFILACSVFRPLSAQAVAEININLLALSEAHVGVVNATGDLAQGHGNHFNFGFDLPIPIINSHWAIRPRIDDTSLGTYSFHYPQTMVKMSLKQYSLGVEALYHPSPYSWTTKGVSSYVGAGVGLVQTWQERKVTGVLTVPGIPVTNSESSIAPGFSLVVGCNLRPALALEVRFQTTRHHFEGSSIEDKTVALCAHVWPLIWFE